MKIQDLMEAKKVEPKFTNKKDKAKFDKFIERVKKKLSPEKGWKYKTAVNKEDGGVDHIFTNKTSKDPYDQEERVFNYYEEDGNGWINWAVGMPNDYSSSGNDPIGDFLNEAGKKSVKNKGKKKALPVDDFDDSDDTPEDPESDKIPHIIMQLRKALDVDGDYPILFRDGKKVKLPMDLIRSFLVKYISAKPLDREKIQDAASQSVEAFKKAAGMEVAQAPKSIYVK